MAFVLASPVLAYGMHQRANAAPVHPTWQQPVVTVDDAEVVEAAQTWGAPFRVEFAADADITVTRAMKGTHVGGEATKAVDGDRITGCTITLRAETVTDAVLAHEVGHCMGLHHDNGHSDSLMYWIQGGDSGADAGDGHGPGGAGRPLRRELTMRLACRIWRHQARLVGLYEIDCARCGWWRDVDGIWTSMRPPTARLALHPDYRRRFPNRMADPI